MIVQYVQSSRSAHIHTSRASAASRGSSNRVANKWLLMTTVGGQAYGMEPVGVEVCVRSPRFFEVRDRRTDGGCRKEENRALW